MVGQIVYTDSQILFILESIRDGVDQELIRDKYNDLFGRKPTLNQIRYVKNKYGKDPTFGTMLINMPTAGGKKRKRTNTNDSNGPAKSKVSPADKKSTPSEEEKEDNMKEEERDEDVKLTTPSKTPELPSSADPYAVPAPPTADSFDFRVPVLHSNGPALAHAPSFPGYDGQEPRTDRHSSPVRSPRQPLRSPNRHGYNNPQVPNGWGGYMSELPHRPVTSLYAGTGFEGNYTLDSTVQGNYQPAQPRQMPQMPPVHPSQFPGVRYPLPGYGYHGQPYNDPHTMGFMPGHMGGAHVPAFSGHGYGPTDPQLQHGSPETRHVHDAHNVFAQNTHWNATDVPGYYDHMQPNHMQPTHNQMRSIQGTLHSNSATLTQQSQAPPHQDPSNLIPSTIPPPSQSAPPALPEPLPTSSASAPIDGSLLPATPSPSISDKKNEDPSSERDPRPDDTGDDAEKTE